MIADSVAVMECGLNETVRTLLLQVRQVHRETLVLLDLQDFPAYRVMPEPLEPLVHMVQ